MREINVVPDMNGDGVPEIVVISGTQDLMRYQLNRSMVVTRTSKIGSRWGAIVHMTSVGDFRGAGVTDILGITSTGRLIDYRGTGTGAVTDGPEVGHGWSGFTQLRSLGDVNGDGRWDIAGNRASGPLYWYASKKGSFGPATALVPQVAGLGLLA